MDRLRNCVLSVFALTAIIAGLCTVSAIPAAQAAPKSRLTVANSARNLAASDFSGSPVAVSATSSTNAWAVGNQCRSSACDAIAALILRWNGMAWSKVHTPNPSASLDSLSAVSATSSTNAWAVGWYCPTTACAVQHTLILHWNGSTWSRVKSPNPNSAGTNNLNGVNATSAGRAWAVGQYCVSGCNSMAAVQRTLVLRWNGTVWSKVASPNPSAAGNFLDAVRAPSSTSAWAVGEYCSGPCGGSMHTLILRWNGTRWSRVKAPNPTAGGSGNYLYGVSVTSPANAWAVGYNCMSECHTVTLHWNGTAWSRVASPNPDATSGGGLLFGVSAISATNAWAAGWSCEQCAAQHAVLLHWNGKAWSQS